MSELEYFWPLVFGLSLLAANILILVFAHGAKIFSDGINRAKPNRKRLYKYWGIKE